MWASLYLINSLICYTKSLNPGMSWFPGTAFLRRQRTVIASIVSRGDRCIMIH